MKKAYVQYLCLIAAAGLPILTAGMVRADAPITPDPVDFGQVPIGQTNTLPQCEICPSTTGSCAEITGYAIIGPDASDFQVVSQNCTGYMLGPQQICCFNISFTPTIAGPESATLEVYIAGYPAQDNPLSGTGTVPVINITPGRLSFPNLQRVGTTSDPLSVPPIVITNSGNAPLKIFSVSITGADPTDFHISSDTGADTIGTSLPGTTSRVITISFTPTARGNRSANLTITDNATGSPHSVPLSGFATAAVAELSATSVDFGEQQVGTTSLLPQTVSIQNIGDAPLDVSDVSITGQNAGDFKIIDGCTGSSLDQSGSCGILVSFAPAAAGSRSATLVITSDALNSPNQVTLTGTGFYTPQQITQGTLALVNALVTAGALSSGNGNALTVKLVAAIQQMDRGNAAAALGQLGAFINQVNAFVQAGKLTSAQAQPLIHQAYVAMALLGG